MGLGNGYQRLVDEQREREREASAAREYAQHQRRLATSDADRCHHGALLWEPCAPCDADDERGYDPAIHGRWSTAHLAPDVEVIPDIRMVGEQDARRWAMSRYHHDLVARSMGLIGRALWGEAGVRRAPRRPLVALSGGKDSLAVLDLVLRNSARVEALWTDDELEYPGQPEYIETLEATYDIDLTVRLSPATHAGWFRPWSERPYWREPRPDAIPSDGIPTRDWQAQEGYDLVFTGLRAAESRRRRDHLRMAGPLYQGKGGVWYCCPLWDWSADDVWTYIAGHELPYHPAYDVLHGVNLTRYGGMSSDAIAREREHVRLGPLPLASGADLDAGWPGLRERLTARYGAHW